MIKIIVISLLIFSLPGFGEVGLNKKGNSIKGSDYVNKDIFFLNEKQDGINGKIILLIDKNLPKESNNAELEREYKSAILKLVDTNNTTLSLMKLKYPIAYLEKKSINGVTFYFLNTDQYTGMGSYSGWETLLFQVKQGKLVSQTYFDISSSINRPIYLYQSLKRDWRILGKENMIIVYQVFCDPNFSNGINSFITTYVTYIFKKGEWNKYTREVNGFWERDESFPDRSNFVFKLGLEKN